MRPRHSLRGHLHDVVHLEHLLRIVRLLKGKCSRRSGVSAQPKNLNCLLDNAICSFSTRVLETLWEEGVNDLYEPANRMLILLHRLFYRSLTLY